MSRHDIFDAFDALNIWSRGSERAPHKPLLVLYALGRWSRGDHEKIPFSDVDAALTPLLQEFGPSRRSHHPEYPFWRLQNDGVWHLEADGPMRPRTGHADPAKSELLNQQARAGFSDEVAAAKSFIFSIWQPRERQ